MKFVIKKKPPTHTYRVVTEVYEDGEKIASVGHTAIGKDFIDVVPVIDGKVREQWTQVIQSAHIANN